MVIELLWGRKSGNEKDKKLKFFVFFDSQKYSYIIACYISVVKLQEVMDVEGNTMDHEKERVLEIKLTYR